MIEVKNLQFHYSGGEFSLEVPRLKVKAGETVAIIGPSGTGKTTLLNLIAGYFVPRLGSIRVNGAEISAMADGEQRNFRIRNIGLVFQEFELLEYLSVLDNILLPYRITSALRLDNDVRDRALTLSTEVGIEGKLRRNVSQLSQGERQRVAICRALLPEPALLLCDEPTGNLDPENKLHALNSLFRYVRRKGTTLVVVTHDHELLTHFDRVVDFRDLGSWLDHGQEVEGGSLS